MTNLSLPHGIYPYLVSPVNAEGGVDTDVLSRLVDDLICAGVDGLTPLGSTGEVMYLTQDQRRKIVEATLEAAAGRVPVVPGVAAVSTADAVSQAVQWQALGATGIVAMRQNGFATSDEGALGYFEAVARSVSLPIVLYTNPALLGTDFTMDGLRRLAEQANVRYIKDATGDAGRILSLINHVGDQLEVFSASAQIPAIVFLLGGVGWMAGPACVIPRAAQTLRSLVLSGDIPNALALQKVLWPINEAFRKYPLAACIKAALRLRGYEVGEAIAPQQPLSADAEREIAAALDAADAAVTP